MKKLPLIIIGISFLIVAIFMSINVIDLERTYAIDKYEGENWINLKYYNKAGDMYIVSRTCTWKSSDGNFGCHVEMPKYNDTTSETHTGWSTVPDCKVGSFNFILYDDTRLYQCWDTKTNNEKSLKTVKAEFFSQSIKDVSKSCTYDSTKENSCTIYSPQPFGGTTRTGYTFNGWGEESGCTEGSMNVTISMDSTFYGCWLPNDTSNYYTINYNANGGTGELYTQLKEPGELIELGGYVPTRSEYTFLGWNEDKNATTSSIYPGDFYLGDADITLYAVWKKNSSGGNNYGGNSDSGSGNDTGNNSGGNSDSGSGNDTGNNSGGNSDNETPGESREYYTVKYDLDGGKFVNDSISRTVIANSLVPLEAPKPNPVKEGDEFIGWYQGNNNFTGFDKIITGNLTLKAKYKKSDEYKTNRCDDGDLYDPSTNKCLKIQMFNNSKTLASIYDQTRSCVNSLFTMDEGDCSGNCNKEECSSGYTSESWKSDDTCLQNSSCNSSGTSPCIRKYETYCYKTYNPENLGQGIDEEKENANNKGDKQEENKNDGKAEYNPDTGDILIYTVLLIGVVAFGCATYYYNITKKNDV